MKAEQALEWLITDVGIERPDAPASNEDALLRAIPLDDGDDGAYRLVTAIVTATLTTEANASRAVAKAFIFGARLARHAADLERIGERS